MTRNPYFNRSMIREIADFYGRQREMEQVLTRVGAWPPQSVSIVGERRIGKSSLLWYLAQQEIVERYLDSPEQYVVLFWDWQGQQHLDLAGVCQVVGQSLRTAVGARLDIPELQTLIELERVVRRLEQADLRLIWLFDEFEAVARNPHVGASFFGFLRSLANTAPVALVTASRREIQVLCQTREVGDSAFFNIFTTVDLGPFLEGEARQLIVEPSAAAGRPLAPYIEWILGLAGRHPFFLQVACSAVFDALGQDGAHPDLPAADARFLREATPQFRALWEHFEEGQRLTFQRLVAGAGLTPDDGPVLTTLLRAGYLDRHGSQLRLFSRAFEGFVRQTIPDATALRRVGPSPPPLIKRGATAYITPVPPGVRPFPELIGESRAIRQVVAVMERAVASEVPVLLLGETGTGKELVARTIHRSSTRRDRSFIAVNCGAIPEQLQESELFGHTRGAFTDAVVEKEGLFEAADGGTLFLDEVTELSAATQTKLLRVLQDGEIRRVGDTETRTVNVRLICATNRDLEDEVAQGRFREDLYYRLYALVLTLPALRERPDDIPLLIRHVLQGYTGGMSEAAVMLLQAYAWPGNVRELANQVATAKALAGGCRIEPEHLWPHVRGSASLSLLELSPDMETDQVTLTGIGQLTLKAAREQLERTMIARRLTVHQRDLGRVATSLGISRGHLYELIQRYGLV